jgi:hypothetical protein
MKHLVDRFREGRISVDDFDALQDWLNSNPSSSRNPRFSLFWGSRRQQVARLQSRFAKNAM